MQRIYFDNAATTPLDPIVLETMMPFFTEKFGNPSSIYSYGRETKMAVENARKTVAKLVNAKPAEIFFTSGGTESTNTALLGAVHDLKCTHIISSKIEHHATLHTVELLAKKGEINLSFVNVDAQGHIDLEHLEQLLKQNLGKTLVTLLHGNNEIGNILPIEKVGNLCEKYQAIFHTDAVQTLAHYPLNVQQMKVHLLSGAGHKFHGPKGVGLLYVNENITISPLLQGGGQERNMRSGTENIYGVVGFAKAMELCLERYEVESKNILELKQYMWQQLQQHIDGVVLNGDCMNGLYTVLNVGFVNGAKAEMLLYSLDIEGICISGGSACTSGANHASHVIAELANRQNVIPIRFSFSRNNTKAEVDIVVAMIAKLINKK
jgi:cysteine desulfurase